MRNEGQAAFWAGVRVYGQPNHSLQQTAPRKKRQVKQEGSL